MELHAVRDSIHGYISEHEEVLNEHTKEIGSTEFKGTFPVMQGKQKVNGHYFASTVMKPKDVRLYFFPIYTHPDAFSLSEGLQKMLKGKSCFHLNKWDEPISEEVKRMIDKGVTLYKAEGWI